MPGYQIQKQYHVMIDGEEIIVTEEVYYAYKRPLWRERKRREREAQCQGLGTSSQDCSHCKYLRIGRPLSLEQLIEDGLVPAGTFSVDEYAEKMELYGALHDALSMLDEKDRLIADLYSEGLSEREIAGRVGLSQKGVNYRKGKIFSRLRELLEDFR